MVGVKPDNVTFITVFTACSDLGMEHEEDIRMPTCCSLKEKAVAWGLDKAPGCSSIEDGDVANEFVSGEKTRHRIEEIHTLLENLNRQYTVTKYYGDDVNVSNKHCGSLSSSTIDESEVDEAVVSDGSEVDEVMVSAPQVDVDDA
ncbi:hypothetical protein Tco_0800955 [Tanacetum coccineum]|uniref:Uncharacterized protein n=1 Tax=Tanacetum coccineum TaxID=301880 RepID=A0ABQ4ZYP2_9ASTR